MDKKKLISEELKRHMELLEYTFYMEDKPAEDDIDNLLLGAEQLYEQDPVSAEGGEEEDTVEDPFAAEGGEEEETVEDPFAAEGGEEEETLDLDTEEGTGETDPFAGEEGMEVEDEFATDEGGEDTVEVDVTDIVDKAEQTNISPYLAQQPLSAHRPARYGEIWGR